MTNPLLMPSKLPAFDQIKITQFKPALQQLMAENRALLSELLAADVRSWGAFAQPLAIAEEKLSHVWSLMSHYKAVLDSEELRELYKQMSAEITDYHTQRGQNKELYLAYQSIADSAEYSALNEAAQKSLLNILRDFRLSGVALPDDKKIRLASIKKELVTQTNQFAENVLDATQAWRKHIVSEQDLLGVPDSAKRMFATKAVDKEHEGGWLIDLEMPSYLPLMTYAENRDLREEMYRAYLTRASEQASDKQWDNSSVIEKILTLRKEMASLLGFDNFSDLSLERKMAESSEQVMSFLTQLGEKSKALALQEKAQLAKFAREKYGYDSIEAWDVLFLSESLKQQKFEVEEEKIRAYFPLPRVLDGLFEITKRLFDVDVSEHQDAKTPHPDTKCFALSRQGETLAYVYMDFYAREGKRGGAWVGSCHRRSHLQRELRLPIAFLVCNFTPPDKDRPSLLTHQELTTLFHEFGHALHYCLTTIDLPDVAGISGVPWDAVELPSQLMENWCWAGEGLSLISGHYETGERLPDTDLQKLLQVKNYHAGMLMARQLEFASFDFILHRDYRAGETKLAEIFKQVRDQFAVIQPPNYARFSHAFTHIFAGGYAAGYYSYKWAEVLAADAFSAFEEEGIFNAKTGKRFRSELLELGGSRDISVMFKSFRGREARVDALLGQMGIEV